MNSQPDMTSTPSPNQWNAKLYDSKHSFVYQFGTGLIELLSPKTGEYILDLGCGTGHLTNKIATNGAEVIGIDNSAPMIEQARNSYPNLDFQLADASNLQFTNKFDAIFSNAVLHWIKEPEKVIASIYNALKPGGRFVAEFGGQGNTKAIVAAIEQAIQAAGYPANKLNPWYYPSIAEYGTLLEKRNLQLTFATLFERPTPLEQGDKGLENWLRMFANSFLAVLPTDKQINIIADIENQLRPSLYQNGTWVADYRRLRIVAFKE